MVSRNIFIPSIWINLPKIKWGSMHYNHRAERCFADLNLLDIFTGQGIILHSVITLLSASIKTADGFSSQSMNLKIIYAVKFECSLYIHLQISFWFIFLLVYVCFLHVCLHITNMLIVPAQRKVLYFSELELVMPVTCHVCGKWPGSSSLEVSYLFFFQFYFTFQPKFSIPPLLPPPLPPPKPTPIHSFQQVRVPMKSQ